MVLFDKTIFLSVVRNSYACEILNSFTIKQDIISDITKSGVKGNSS